MNSSGTIKKDENFCFLSTGLRWDNSFPGPQLFTRRAWGERSETFLARTDPLFRYASSFAKRRDNLFKFLPERNTSCWIINQWSFSVQKHLLTLFLFVPDSGSDKVALKTSRRLSLEEAKAECFSARWEVQEQRALAHQQLSEALSDRRVDIRIRSR